MKNFKIVTSSTALTEYVVIAKNAKQAEELFFDGNFESEKVTDWQDEEIMEVEEL